MLKQLLMSAALATVAISASAESKVLWQSEDPAGVLVGWGNPALTLSAEEAASIKAGDYLTMTVEGVDPENGWPQVALFQGNVGWPPAVNEGVGGKEYPFVASFGVTPEFADSIHAYGIVFKGDGAYVSAVGLKEGNINVGPNTVWFGPKECGWGNGVSISKEVFSNVAPGDKIVVEYDKGGAESTLQFLFGGWSGLNIPSYEAWKTDFVTRDEEAGTFTIALNSSLSDLTWEAEGEEKQYDVFALLKEGGLIMHGPCIVNQVLYIRGEVAEDPVFPENIEYTLNGEKELAGVTVTQGYDDEWETNTFNVSGKCDADKITIKFETPEGWDGILTPLSYDYDINPLKTRGEWDWAPLDEMLESGWVKSNELTFAVDGEEQNDFVAFYKGDQVYQTMLYVYFAVEKEGEVVKDPVFPESLGVTTYAEGLEVEQNNEDGEIFIAVTGEIEETTFDVVLDVPEGWTGFISMPVETDDVTISEHNVTPIDPRMAKVQEADWVPVEDVMDEGVFKGNKFTFKANGTRLQVEVHLYKDDMVDVANFITLTANVKSKLVEANQAAYEEVISKIEAVEKEYAESLDALKKEYPDYDFSEWETIIGGQLTQAKEGAAQALAAANEDGADFNFAFDEDEYMNMISEMNARVPLLASNQAAYEAVIAQLDELQKKSDEAAAKIKEMNPDYDLSALDELNAMIEEYRQYALIALNNANEEGEEFFFPFDAEEYEAYIAMEVMTATPAPEYPESFEITSSCESLDIEQEDFDGATIVTVTGACPEKEYTITVKVPEGWDGFIGASDADGGNEPMPLMDKVVKETEWWFVSDMLAQGLRMTNSFTFPADGEEHYAQLMLVKGEYADVVNHINIDVKVSYDATVGVSGVNAEENAIYFDLQGNRIANPAKGIYVKVVDGKATKINVR